MRIVETSRVRAWREDPPAEQPSIEEASPIQKLIIGSAKPDPVSRNVMPEPPPVVEGFARDDYYSLRQTARALIAGGSGGGVIWLYMTHDAAAFWSGVISVLLVFVIVCALKGNSYERHAD